MHIVWRTLLLIALCVQMPLGALASYADQAPHRHDHSHSELHSHGSHASHTHEHHADNTETDCSTAHHHCAASHLSLMVQTHLPTLISSQREVFSLSAEAFSLTQLLPSIDRPKWASI